MSRGGLRACPFCGRKVTARTIDDEYVMIRHSNGYRGCVLGNGVLISAMDVDDYAERWNRRVGDERP